MSEYRVELEAYSGPLDLLLYLVRRHEIDLNDIPIAQLTDQYLRHLELIKQLDMENVGEFVVMAATLLEIKSAMLLPQPEQAATADGGTTENPLDPRYELVQQLLAYKRFKDAAAELDRRRQEWEARYPHQPAKAKKPSVSAPEASGEGSESEGQEAGEFEEESAPLREFDLEDVHVLDLCEAFARILSSIGQNVLHEVVYDDTPLSLHAEDILDRLKRDGPLSLQDIFVGRKSRSEMIGLFLATLELVRQRKVKVLQEQDRQLRLELRPEQEQQTPADTGDVNRWRDPQTGQMQYEWPSEAERLRAERRARLRAKFAQRKLEGEKISEEEERAAMEAEEGPEAEG